MALLCDREIVRKIGKVPAPQTIRRLRWRAIWDCGLLLFVACEPDF